MQLVLPSDLYDYAVTYLAPCKHLDRQYIMGGTILNTTVKEKDLALI